MVVSTSLWNIASLAHLLCLHINHFSATNNVPYFEHYTRCMCDVCYTYDMFKVWMSDCAWMPCYAAAKVVLHVDTLMLVDNHQDFYVEGRQPVYLQHNSAHQGRVYSGTEAGKRYRMDSTGIHICFSTHLLCECLMCMEFKPMQR